MAKRTKDGVNKSAEIRKLIQANPKMTAQEIIEALAKQNIEVSGGLVYLIRSKMRARKSKRKREKAVKVASANGHGDPLVVVRKVKTLAAEVGGYGKLKALLEVLSE